jgi:DNA-directed RNA polymerase specialized sigma24 family protein
MHALTPKITRFRAGSESAFAELFALFYPRQVRQAEALLGHRRTGLCDGEDIALSAFRSFWREGIAGHFPGGLEDTSGLLAVLRLLTTQKALKARQFNRRKKRDLRRTVRAADQLAAIGSDPSGETGLNPVDDLPTTLSPRQRTIARMAGEGWERAEIADRLGCSIRTVDRELADIRRVIRDQFTGLSSLHDLCQVPPDSGQ